MRAAQATADGTDLLAFNASGAFARGLSTQEFTIGYAYLVPMPFFTPLEGKVSVGANFKYMLGISYTRFVDYDEAVFERITALLEPDGICPNTDPQLSAALRAAVDPMTWRLYRVQQRLTMKQSREAMFRCVLALARSASG